MRPRRRRARAPPPHRRRLRLYHFGQGGRKGLPLGRPQPAVPRHAVEGPAERGRRPRREGADSHRLHPRDGHVDESRRRQYGRHPPRGRAAATAVAATSSSPPTRSAQPPTPSAKPPAPSACAPVLLSPSISPSPAAGAARRGLRSHRHRGGSYPPSATPTPSTVEYPTSAAARSPPQASPPHGAHGPPRGSPAH